MLPGGSAAKLAKISSFERAGKFGIKSYKELKRLTKGLGLHVHHLIPQRFAKLFGTNTGDMASIVLTRDEHQVFTNAWRKAIKYGEGTVNATVEQVNNAAKQIYKDYPEILDALGL